MPPAAARTRLTGRPTQRAPRSGARAEPSEPRNPRLHPRFLLQVPIEEEEAAAEEKPAKSEEGEEGKKAEEAKEGETVEVEGEPAASRCACCARCGCCLSLSEAWWASAPPICLWRHALCLHPSHMRPACPRPQVAASACPLRLWRLLRCADEEEDEAEKKPKTKKVTETVTEWKALNDNQVSGATRASCPLLQPCGAGAAGARGHLPGCRVKLLAASCCGAHECAQARVHIMPFLPSPGPPATPCPPPPAPQALWLRPPGNVSDEEYAKFYKARCY